MNITDDSWGEKIAAKSNTVNGLMMPDDGLGAVRMEGISNFPDNWVLVLTYTWNIVIQEAKGATQVPCEVHRVMTWSALTQLPSTVDLSFIAGDTFRIRVRVIDPGTGSPVVINPNPAVAGELGEYTFCAEIASKTNRAIVSSSRCHPIRTTRTRR